MSFNNYGKLHGDKKNLANYFMYNKINALLSELNREQLIEFCNNYNLFSESKSDINDYSNSELKKLILGLAPKFSMDENILNIEQKTNSILFKLKDIIHNNSCESNKIYVMEKLLFNDMDLILDKIPADYNEKSKVIEKLSYEYFEYAVKNNVLSDNAMICSVAFDSPDVRQVKEEISNITNNVNNIKKRSK